MSVVFEDGVECIDEKAFAGCISLQYVNIPASVSEISSDAFIASGIRSYNVDENNNDYCSIDGVLFSNNRRHLLAFPSAVTGEYVVPAYVQTVEDFAFANSKLGKLVLNEGLKTIEGYSVFYKAEFETLVLPSSLEAMDLSAIMFLPNLKKLYAKMVNPFQLKDSFDDDVLFRPTLYIPIGTRDLYMNAGAWRHFKNIVEIDYSTTSINQVKKEAPVEVARYNLNGERVGANVPGVHIVRMSDGTVKKVLVK